MHYSQQSYETDTFAVPILLMRNLRLREVKLLAQGHTVNHGRWDLDSVCQAPKLMVFATALGRALRWMVGLMTERT